MTTPEGELCLNYGPLSNAHLLKLYKFVCQDNVYDAIDIYAAMSENAHDYLIKSQALNRLGLYMLSVYILDTQCRCPPKPHLHLPLCLGTQNEQKPPYQIVPKEEPPEQAALRAHHTHTPSLLACGYPDSAGEELSRLDKAMTGMLSESNERQALLALRGALEGMLAAMSPMVEEEKVDHSGGSQGVDVKLARRYIREERKLLGKAVERIKEMLSKL